MRATDLSAQKSAEYGRFIVNNCSCMGRSPCSETARIVAWMICQWRIVENIFAPCGDAEIPYRPILMNSLVSTPYVEIELSALARNFRAIADATPGAEPAAVVKCDAYGLGLSAVSRALALKEKCRTFFVAHAPTGADLRNALSDVAPNAEIYVFNGPAHDTIALFHDHALLPVINTLDQARLWNERGDGAPIALHVDTGMNRLGLPDDELDALTEFEHLNVSVIMSHFACASTPGAPMLEQQRTKFEQMARRFPEARRSLASTGGALMNPEYGYDLTRLGVGVYGVGPFDGPHPDIMPVARLAAPILQIRDVAAGESTGYDRTHVFTGRARIATVALGYGDGVPRAASNAGVAYVGGARTPVVGRVSMDLIVLDITQCPQPVAPGDVAEFYGPTLPIEDAAAACGTIGYELLTGLGPRVERRYLWNGEPADHTLTGVDGGVEGNAS